MSEQERKSLLEDLDITLNEAEKQILKAAFNKSFKQLLPMVNQLYDKVVAAQTTEAVRA